MAISGCKTTEISQHNSPTLQRFRALRFIRECDPNVPLLFGGTAESAVLAVLVLFTLPPHISNPSLSKLSELATLFALFIVPAYSALSLPFKLFTILTFQRSLRTQALRPPRHSHPRSSRHARHASSILRAFQVLRTLRLYEEVFALLVITTLLALSVLLVLLRFSYRPLYPSSSRDPRPTLPTRSKPHARPPRCKSNPGSLVLLFRHFNIFLC